MAAIEKAERAELISMFDKLTTLISRMTTSLPTLNATKKDPHPDPKLRKKGWHRISIRDNPYIEGFFDYKGQKRGRISLTFYDERGMPISRWNTHRRQDIRHLHRDDLVTKAKDLPFKKRPPISPSFLEKLDQASPEKLKQIRARYE